MLAKHAAEIGGVEKTKRVGDFADRHIGGFQQVLRAADFSQKLFVKVLPGTSAAVFNLYTYVFAALTLLLIVLLLPHGEKEEGKGARRSHAYITVMAAALILNSYFKTLAASHLSSAQLYPLNQGAGLILSSLMAHFLFRERLTKKAIGGIALAFAGLMIMNML